MLPINQIAFSLSVVCGYRTLFFPILHRDALPLSYKQHLMFGLDSPPDRTGREPIFSESKSDMLAIALPNNFV
jgi:hypothetical protein